MSKTNFQTQVEFRIEAMKSMMDSCYCYHSLSKNEKYLQTFKEQLGEDIFNRIFDEYAEHLRNTFEVVDDVFKDSEGVSYNKLVKKSA